DVKVVAVADGRAEKREGFAAKFGAEPFADAQTMIESVEADIVDVCLPTREHAPCSLLAIDRGLHVFCEKPMAWSVAEAQQVARAAEERGVRFMVGHVIRFAYRP